MGSAASGLITAVSPSKVTVTFPPGWSPMRARMEAVRALLQPSELVSRRRAEPENPETGKAPVSDAEERRRIMSAPATTP